MKNTRSAAKVNGEAGQQDNPAERGGASSEGNGPPAPPPLRAIDIALKTMLGDGRDAMIDGWREMREPWHKLSEKQQTYYARLAEDLMRSTIHQIVALVAANDFPTIAVTLEQIAFKPKGIEAKLALNAIDRVTRHQLVDAQGKPVLIVIADPAAFMGARGPAKIDKQAPELPLDEAEPNGEAVGPPPGEEGHPFAEADAADLKIPANRADGGLPPPAARNIVADDTGFTNGFGGHRDHAARFPAGTPGHGDYELGHEAGQQHRLDMGMPVEAAAVISELTTPVEPKRRGRPRKDPGRQDRSL